MSQSINRAGLLVLAGTDSPLLIDPTSALGPVWQGTLRTVVDKELIKPKCRLGSGTSQTWQNCALSFISIISKDRSLRPALLFASSFTACANQNVNHLARYAVCSKL